MLMNQALLTATETASYLGVKVQTLAVWRSVGRYPELRYVKVGNSIRYRLADVEGWLATRTMGKDA